MTSHMIGIACLIGAFVTLWFSAWLIDRMHSEDWRIIPTWVTAVVAIIVLAVEAAVRLQ